MNKKLFENLPNKSCSLCAISTKLITCFSSGIFLGATSVDSSTNVIPSVSKFNPEENPGGTVKSSEQKQNSFQKYRQSNSIKDLIVVY